MKVGAAVLVEAEGCDIDAWLDRRTVVKAMADESWVAANDRDGGLPGDSGTRCLSWSKTRLRSQGFTKLGSDYLARNFEMLVIYRRTLEVSSQGAT